MGDGSLQVHATPLYPTHPEGHPQRPVTPNRLAAATSWTETCGYDLHDLAAVQHELLTRDDRFVTFDLRLQDTICLAQGTTTPCTLYMLPVGFCWLHCHGMTVIGDAAHLMTPFAGESVNVALGDARKPAAAILRAVKPTKETATETVPDANALDKVVTAFELERWSRTER